jgi:hypothetical protein
MLCAPRAALAAVALALATACIESQAPVPDSEGHSFHDAVRQEQFKQKLMAAGVPFTTETVDGQEFVRWTKRDADRANAIRQEVFGPDLPPGRHIAYDGATQASFKAWLTENGIPFSTAQKDGREYVIWEPAVDNEVRKWHLSLPP